MSELKRRVAIITGGSRGIGKGIAINLAKNDIDVFLIATKEIHLKEVKSKIEKLGEPHGKCEFYITDMKKAAQQCISSFGSIDILVNNAGIMPISWVKSMKEDEWDKMVDINCKGALNGVAACLPYMMEKKNGHIIFMSSDAGKKAFPGLAVYCGTKYFIEGFVQCLRQEMKEFNIKVTTIQPGDVGTDIGMDTTDTEAYDEICKEKHKILKVSDIANAVYYSINQPDYCSVNEILIEPTELPI